VKQSEACVVHKIVVYKLQNFARIVAIWRLFLDIQPLHAMYLLPNHGWRNGRRGPTKRLPRNTTLVHMIFV